MNINYVISPYPSLTQNMVAKVYEVGPSGSVAEVDSLIIPEKNSSGVPTPGAGHQVPNNISFNGRDMITHEVRLYTNSGTLLHKYQVQPTINTVTVFTPIRFRIGDGGTYTPAAGTSSYINPDLAGVAAADYMAYRNGYGFVFEGVHIVNNVLGGFDLAQAGDVFSGDPAEEWTIIQQPQAVVNLVNDSVVGKQWGPTTGNSNMYVDVSSSVDYSPIHLRKLIRMSGNSAAFHFRVAPPIGYPFRFTNVGAYNFLTDTPKVYFDNAPLISGNSTAASFDLPFGSVVEFVWDGTNYNKSVINIGVPVAPTTIKIEGRGIFVVGDVPPTATGWPITHNLGLSGDYIVFTSIFSGNTSNHSKDIKVNVVWWHHETDKPNKFWLAAQELSGEVQNLSICWMIVKMP